MMLHTRKLGLGDPNLAPNGTCTGMTVMGPNGTCICPSGENPGPGICTVVPCPTYTEWSSVSNSCVPVPQSTPSNPCPPGLQLESGQCVNPATGVQYGTLAQIAANQAQQVAQTQALIASAPIPTPTLPATPVTIQPTQQQLTAATAPAGSAAASSNGFSWLTQSTYISGIPNWEVIGALAAAAFVLAYIFTEGPKE